MQIVLGFRWESQGVSQNRFRERDAAVNAREPELHRANGVGLLAQGPPGPDAVAAFSVLSSPAGGRQSRLVAASCGARGVLCVLCL